MALCRQPIYLIPFASNPYRNFWLFWVKQPSRNSCWTSLSHSCLGRSGPTPLNKSACPCAIAGETLYFLIAFTHSVGRRHKNKLASGGNSNKSPQHNTFSHPKLRICSTSPPIFLKRMPHVSSIVSSPT